MNDYTYFVFEHNQSGAIFEILVEVFDIQGRRIDYFKPKLAPMGLTSNPVRWDLSELKQEARNGIYLYRITVQNKMA